MERIGEYDEEYKRTLTAQQLREITQRPAYIRPDFSYTRYRKEEGDLVLPTGKVDAYDICCKPVFSNQGLLAVWGNPILGTTTIFYQNHAGEICFQSFNNNEVNIFDDIRDND